ncbi:ADP-ribosylglycohydrolase family protein [Actinokineospora sp. NBRC 105648]|uniref:ADP-ribosylglycohydrolase family protein n=1 Tax=Actinokineospora sp. NBRC 105648 TaxID=3032206 RepID=UPI0024A2D762|nr:ADP-ribosylglycohydrolase family protein [Actinokineospora sp. NBRC 105648]GLZ36842.1 hypothetical protein Acsp05_04670 [Actinokineospora sp. NBRC 105648]
MLVELAVGDAYGAGFEYAASEFVLRHNTLRGYVQHAKHTSIRPGQYTDDTQMTLAVAELLADGGTWTAAALADRFVEVFHRDRRAGYAARFYDLLRGLSDGADLLAKIRPDSDKSGAAMRAGPVGLLPTVPDVLHHAAVQARITHDTPDGVASAQAAALAVHYCDRQLGPVARLPEWISAQVDGDWATPWRGKVGSKGVMSVRAAITALAAGGGLSSILHACVAFTGDVDTVATVALAAASRTPEIAADLPAVLLDGLENDAYGRDYLTALDIRLLAVR